MCSVVCSDDEGSFDNRPRRMLSPWAVAPSASGLQTPLEVDSGPGHASEDRSFLPSAFSGALNLFSQPVDAIRKKRRR